MIKNRKGFTLVELLAVIVVLAIIGVIAVKNVSDTLERASISSFKSSNDILIKEIKSRIEKKRLGINEQIACSNYGQNNCTDIYDLSKEDYALSITDLGNDNYDVILVGKGAFEGIDVDGYGNSMIRTRINDSEVSNISLIYKQNSDDKEIIYNYGDVINFKISLEEKLHKIVKESYEQLMENYDADYFQYYENHKFVSCKSQGIDFPYCANTSINCSGNKDGCSCKERYYNFLTNEISDRIEREIDINSIKDFGISYGAGCNGASTDSPVNYDDITIKFSYSGGYVSYLKSLDYYKEYRKFATFDSSIFKPKTTFFSITVEREGGIVE